ncbi:Metalloprotease [Heliocybe sulcata]|uniref:deuterolysin n=1 Tax=Heliocybe sulcata TaxID=5364 RepID=A0A5C3N7P1_9AGAM|nr:Metalloprotease [Heliocybe sulcata]
MLCLSLITLSLSALAYASPAKRAQALSVSVTGPGSVDSISDLKLTALVKNSGAEDVKILKYGTVLDGSMPTRSFRVSKDGKAAKFTGVKMSVDMKKVGDNAFVTIPAGQTYTVEHDISSLYDFETLGTGSYSIEPVTTFQIMSNESEPASKAKAQIGAEAVSVTVNKDVAKKDLKVNTKRATVSCDTSDASYIRSSYSEGQTLAQIASDYVSSNGADDLFTSYFGTTSTGSVIDVLDNVANEDDSSRTLNCDDPYDACEQGVIAYTLIATTNIYFCDIFYDEVPQSNLCSGTSVADRDIRGGTVLHELTHATSDTEDVGYGCSSDQSLASSDPESAANNADNYNCFATQVYADTQC